MTAALTKAGEAFLRSRAYDTASTTVGMIAFLVLIALLIEKELLRAYGGERNRKRMVAMNIMIVPLLLAVCVVVIRRMLDMQAGAG